MGDRLRVVHALHSLSRLARLRGEYAAARALLVEDLRVGAAMKDAEISARALEEAALLASREGDAPRATRLFGAAAALRERIGAPMWPSERVEREECRAALRETLGDPAFTRAWEAGQALTWEAAVVEARGPHTTPAE
jgi:hypothetical protein